MIGPKYLFPALAKNWLKQYLIISTFCIAKMGIFRKSCKLFNEKLSFARNIQLCIHSSRNVNTSSTARKRQVHFSQMIFKSQYVKERSKGG